MSPMPGILISKSNTSVGAQPTASQGAQPSRSGDKQGAPGPLPLCLPLAGPLALLLSHSPTWVGSSCCCFLDIGHAASQTQQSSVSLFGEDLDVLPQACSLPAPAKCLWGALMMTAAPHIPSASFQLATGLPAQLPPACHCVGLLERALGQGFRACQGAGPSGRSHTVSEDN